ncbi:MAG TPA: hypothetical protein PLC99_16995 [Verrucomicrobiota bacterium]|nr:hypothetical protein [Verrucomicrobiota bacterium]
MIRRFRRPFPLAFLVLAFLAVLGGVLHPPTNPDGMSHRLPRVLNWLAEERWHWITNHVIMNTQHAGFEWMMAPMLALTRTDRWVFFYNAVSFLLLPGLVFGVLRRLEVRGRVAWHWMWIAPSGYCFLLQAGSIGNDAAGATVALTALYFALRARKSRSHLDLWLSILSAGLMTAIKSSNLPLLLPWFLAMLPSVKLVLARPLSTVLVGVAALVGSYLPTAALNHFHLGDWSGMSVLTPAVHRAHPATLVAGNLMNLSVQNLAPPIFPVAQWWNAHAYRVLPQSFITAIEEAFEPAGAHFSLPEIHYEYMAGLGMGVTILLLVSWVIAHLVHPANVGPRFPQSVDQWFLALVRWSPFVVLAVYTLTTAMSTSGRIVTPYYCFFLPFFLVGPGWSKLVRSRTWQFWALLMMLPALVLVVINPPRPLWPAQTVLSRLAARNPHSKNLGTAAILYASYATRWDALADIRQYLPPGEKRVGFISLVGASSLEASLWRPFGQRRIIHVPVESTLEQIAALGIRYVAVGIESPTARIHDVPASEWIENWRQARDGKIVGTARVRQRATKDEAVWHVIELESPINTLQRGKALGP